MEKPLDEYSFYELLITFERNVLCMANWTPRASNTSEYTDCWMENSDILLEAKRRDKSKFENFKGRNYKE